MILSKGNLNSFSIKKEIERKISSGAVDTLLLIVPTNRKLRSLKKEIISASPLNASGRIEIETLGTFTSKLFFIKEKNEKILSEAAASVLLNQCFDETSLTYFNGYGGEVPPGTLQRIKNVITEYKRHGILPDRIRSRNLKGSEKNKADDISAVYESYNKKCRELSVWESGDIYAALNLLPPEEFQTRFFSLYPGVDIIIINGFDEFTLPEINILNSLSEAHPAGTFISFDYFDGNENIFSHLDECYSTLLKKGFKIINDEDETTGSDFLKEAGIPSYPSRAIAVSASLRLKKCPNW
jgi:ATP-dependent helicase/nuclease subunit B